MKSQECLAAGFKVGNLGVGKLENGWRVGGAEPLLQQQQPGCGPQAGQDGVGFLVLT